MLPLSSFQKYSGRGALETLRSNAKGENISTNGNNERVDEAKLSSSLRMFVSKEGSDEEEPQISIDRRSASEGEEEEVIAIDDAMEHATCGRHYKDCCVANLGTIFVSLFCSLIWIVVIVVIIIYAGWTVFFAILLIFVCLLLCGFSDAPC